MALKQQDMPDLNEKEMVSMRFDVQKIDERIKKLQDLRRLMMDPEISSLLPEFLTVGDERRDSMPTMPMPTMPPPPPPPPMERPSPETTNQLVNDVVNGSEVQTGGALWSRRRA